jgi:hypothetical protein
MCCELRVARKVNIVISMIQRNNISEFDYQ